jgi:membrane protein
MSPKKMIVDLGTITRKAAVQWFRDRAPQSAAAVAFYTVFSLAPLVVVVVGVLGVVLSRQEVLDALLQQIRDTIGAEGTQLIRTSLQNIADREGGTMATLAGLAVVLFGATTVFAQLQAQLNALWNVTPKPGKGLRHMLYSRVLSFGFILVLGFFLLVSLIADAVLASFGDLISRRIPNVGPFIDTGNLTVSFVGVVLLCHRRCLTDPPPAG